MKIREILFWLMSSLVLFAVIKSARILLLRFHNYQIKIVSIQILMFCFQISNSRRGNTDVLLFATRKALVKTKSDTVIKQLVEQLDAELEQK